MSNTDVNTDNAGKKLGIIALLLSVFCVPLFGVLVGILAWFKSRAAGQDNLFAVLAIIINLIYTVLLVLFLASIFQVNKTVMEQRQQEETREAQTLQFKELQTDTKVDTDHIAAQVLAKLEQYRQSNGVYPSYRVLMSGQNPLGLSDEQRATLSNTATPRQSHVGFQACVASNGVSSGVMLRPGSGNTPLIAGDCSNIAARRE